MKKFLLIFAAMTALFISCSKDDNKSSYDPFRPVPIRAAAGTRAYIQGNLLSGKQVVQQTWGMKGRYPDGTATQGGGKLFTDAMRDTINPALKLLMKDVVYSRTGEDVKRLDGFFLTLRDVVFTRDLHVEGKDTVFCGYYDDYSGPILYPNVMDTIAYVPNAQLIAAEPLVRAAFERGDYNECYRILEKAYTFIPITGAQWRKLKAENKN
jgi:hypothetical protein|nr:MAG TPA: protein of unknown function (DUF5016) [Caudoviricetes sp.]